MTPELAVTCQGAVYPWRCDHMGPVKGVWHVGKFDEATGEDSAIRGCGGNRRSHGPL